MYWAVKGGGMGGPSGALAWLILGSGLMVAVVNATSAWIDAPDDNLADFIAGPLLNETSSWLALVLLLPALLAAARRWPISASVTSWPHLLLQAGLTVPYSLSHSLLTALLRTGANGLYGATYNYWRDSLPITLLFEWRKDMLAYLAIVSLISLLSADGQTMRHPRAPSARKIAIKGSSTIHFRSCDEISRVEARGNYVEIYFGQGSELVRGKLSEWERELSPSGFVRVHRSRIVNAHRVVAIEPTPAGDLAVLMSDGARVMASRRFRGILESQLVRLTEFRAKSPSAR